MKKIVLNKDWQFRMRSMTAEQYRPVTLPHDYMITQPRHKDALAGVRTGFVDGGCGQYLHHIAKPKAGQRMILDVDGSYMFSQVAVNGHSIFQHPNGYTPFLVDLTDYLVEDDNLVTIDTDDMQPSSRWYSGAGLYRDVFLWTGGETRLEPWSVFLSTISCNSQEALINAQIEVSACATVEVLATIKLRYGQQLATIHQTSSFLALSGKTTRVVQFKLPDPKLWSPDVPSLYDVEVELADAESRKVLDTYTCRFGVRTIEVSVDQGLRLNGEPIQLRGGCIHHDHGVLGAAAFPAAEARKIARLKIAGFNAVRIAHNPPSLALLDTCDEQGMLVMDEAFDMWVTEKSPRDYHLWFEAWCERDLETMVRRDRSHSSVISYSIGNEIDERYKEPEGSQIATRLISAIKRYDDTRLITSAVCGWPGDETVADTGGRTPWQELTQDYMAPLDIVGYNYKFDDYESDHEQFPRRIFWGSETQTIHFYESWLQVEKHPYVLGDFTWTAYDNMGEVGIGRTAWARDEVIDGFSFGDYPWRTCYQGDLDLCGFRRPQSYFREAMWSLKAAPHIFTIHPMHNGETYSGTGWHWPDVKESWTFDPKFIREPVEAVVYTRADEVRFILNGKQIAVVKPVRAQAVAQIPYTPGELIAEILKDGQVISIAKLSTVTEAVQLEVVPEEYSIQADNRDLAYFDISAITSDGKTNNSAAVEIIAKVDGGELMGIFSGAPANEDVYGSNKCHLFNGRALAIVRTSTPGRVALTVEGNRLRAGSASIEAE